MPVKYIAEIKGGKEVGLIGMADYGYWTRALASEALVPVHTNGRAEILLSAVELKWMGKRFSELSVAISVYEADRPGKLGIYLAAAFNTSRVFSFIEKNWFHTPYRHAQVNVSTREPWSFQLTDGADTILQCQRRRMTTPEVCDTHLEGAIYLPHHTAPTRDQFEVFFARLSGSTEIASFDASQDVVHLAASKRHPVVQSLIDSSFTGVQWRIRSNATHARSKTYRRCSVQPH